MGWRLHRGPGFSSEVRKRGWKASLRQYCINRMICQAIRDKNFAAGGCVSVESEYREPSARAGSRSSVLDLATPRSITMPLPDARKTYGTVSAEQRHEMSGLQFVQGLADGTLPLNTIAGTLGYDVS